jgi:hypothetical protein
VATLFFVPTVFSVLHRRPNRGASGGPDDQQAEAVV